MDNNDILCGHHYSRLVPLWVCALWGLFGGAAVEGLEWRAAMQRTGQWPWGRRRSARGPFLASVMIRVGVGAGLATAVGASGPVSALGALAAGIAAPLMIEKLAQQLPVGILPQAAPADDNPGGGQAAEPLIVTPPNKPRDGTASGAADAL